MVYAKEFLSAFGARPRKKKKQPKATLNLPNHTLLNIKIKNSTCFNSQREKIPEKDLHKDEHHFTVTGQQYIVTAVRMMSLLQCYKCCPKHRKSCEQPCQSFPYQLH